MNKFLILYSLIICQLFPRSNDEILFQIDNNIVFVEEFERVFNKNINIIDKENKKDFDSYFNLFLNFKIKIAEAYYQNLHEDSKYINELQKYIKQLQNAYLTDKSTQEKLLKEAYERTKFEVNASHVLIRIDKDNNDTIEIFNKLNSLRNDFLHLSLDQFNQKNNSDNDMIVEDLGYFSAFRMIYKFENVAYNTNIGDVSAPFRTQFGFHIIKVNEKRKSMGEVSVGHIMIYKNNPRAQVRIYDLYDSIRNGVNFEYLAKKFSEDKNSSFRGGVLNPFSSGQINSTPFEKAAFSLSEKNNISKPVETKYGWHIIKYYSKKDIKSFKDTKSELLNKLKKSDRSNIISTSFYSFLMGKYNVSYNNEHLDYFVSIIDSSYFKNMWSFKKDDFLNKEMLNIGEKKLSFLDFATFLKENQKSVNFQNFDILVTDQFKKFIQINIVDYYKKNLFEENLDYRNIVTEYREGLLLFNLMENNIWNVKDSDSTSLKIFFDKNKNNYSSYEENKGEVIADYQNFKEKIWLEELKSKFKITLNKKAIKKLKKKYN